MISVYRVAVLVFTSLCGFTSCHALDTADVEQDTDDLWPVLCRPNTYYSRIKDQCLDCSQCPLNKIITVPCHGFHDTRCGPFYDFNDFMASDIHAGDKSEKPTGHHKKNPKVSSDQSDGKSANKKQSFSDKSRDNFETSDLDKTSEDTYELTDSEWKSLTICLFVFLSLFALTILAIGICIFRRKNKSAKKFLLDYSPPAEDV